MGITARITETRDGAAASQDDAREGRRRPAAPRPPSALIVVENLPVPFDRRVWQEATALAEAGWTVSVICPRGKGHDARRETLDGIAIYRHSLPREGHGAVAYLREYLWALVSQLWLSLVVARERGFDVLHACNPPDLIFIVAAFHKLFRGTRFVFDHHDLSPELYEAKFGRRGAFHWLLLRFERMTFALADVSIATNETFKRIAVERGGMDPDKVWVVKSYPRIERFRPTTPNPVYAAQNRSLVGYVGIMGSQDGVDGLVRAMAEIVHDRGRDDVGCVIVGDGPELPALRALAEELDVVDHVDFTGYLTGEDLLSTLSALDVGVIPDPADDFNDKLSMNKVFEYMMLGLPFVMFDLKQARSEAGEAALVASVGTPAGMADALLELIDDQPRRKRMGRLGRARAEQEFQWSREKTSLLEAYAAVA